MQKLAGSLVPNDFLQANRAQTFGSPPLELDPNGGYFQLNKRAAIDESSCKFHRISSRCAIYDRHFLLYLFDPNAHQTKCYESPHNWSIILLIEPS